MPPRSSAAAVATAVSPGSPSSVPAAAAEIASAALSVAAATTAAGPPPPPVSASSPQPAERPATAAGRVPNQVQVQNQARDQVRLQEETLNHHHNNNNNLHNAPIIPALHQNLDAAYERLSALLHREQVQAVQGYGGLLECHVAKPRFLVRKRGPCTSAGAGAGGAGVAIAAPTKREEEKDDDVRTKRVDEKREAGRTRMIKDGGDKEEVDDDDTSAADGPEGRQPAEEFDPQHVRRGTNGGSAGSTSTGGGTFGDDGEAILRKLLLQVGEDEEVDEVPLSDVGLVYRRAGLDRNGQVVRHLHRLATGVFGESDEIVEVSCGVVGFGL